MPGVGPDLLHRRVVRRPAVVVHGFHGSAGRPREPGEGPGRASPGPRRPRHPCCSRRSRRLRLVPPGSGAGPGRHRSRRSSSRRPGSAPRTASSPWSSPTPVARPPPPPPGRRSAPRRHPRPGRRPRRCPSLRTTRGPPNPARRGGRRRRGVPPGRCPGRQQKTRTHADRRRHAGPEGGLVHREQQAVARGAVLPPRHRDPGGEYPVGQAECVERAHRVAGQIEAEAGRRRTGSPLDHRHVGVDLPQGAGRGQAGDAGTDDEHAAGHVYRRYVAIERRGMPERPENVPDLPMSDVPTHSTVRRICSIDTVRDLISDRSEAARCWASKLLSARCS